jgi:putative tricarboxylic transport membrane protein
MEQNLRRAMALSGGELNILYSSGITLFLWACTALVLFAPLLLRYMSRRSKVAQPAEQDLE